MSEKLTQAELIRAVQAYAREHYDDDGWDVITDPRRMKLKPGRSACASPTK